MKTDKNQMTFGQEFARPLKPADDIHEPLVWFESLHLIRRIGPGEDQGNVIRKFRFHRGLNILWAEPEDPEENARLYGDGFAGHSTGKTLFCRILRHLLGEPNYGTKELQEHIVDTFSSLWAIASVRLNEQSWILGRPMAGIGTDFAIENGRIESVLAEVPTFTGFEKFTEQLEKVCGAPLAQMYPQEGWRNLLPWIARDQEARLASITAWRESSSEADNPRTSAAAQNLILRAVLRLLEPDEFTMRQEIAAIEETLKTWNADLPSKTSMTSRDLARAQRTIRSIRGLSVNLNELSAAKSHVISQRTIRREALEHFRSEPESEGVQTARIELQKAISAKTSADDRIEILNKEIPLETEEAEKQLLTVERIKKSGFTDSARVADNFCPNSYVTACTRECVTKPPEFTDPSMVEIRELEAQAKARSESVQSKRAEKARLESQLDQFDAEIRSKRTTLNAVVARSSNPVASIQREITLLESAEREIDDAIRSATEEQTVNSRIREAGDRIKSLKEDLARLKVDAEQRLRGFSEVFADVARAVLGTSISAYADLGERSINLQAKRNGRELGGAAVESIKTLAFDLAALVHSIEGKCDHPRFLIHDGPREADMARVTYEHFFLWAERLEASFPEERAPFQYILTTTTHPPSHMREGSKWLLGEKLSGKSKEGRLLKEDF